jgi:two-component system, chemotaxis family, chemotaxis protein CheY
MAQLAARAKKRVVLVDDDEEIRMIVGTAINSLNCEVVAEGASGAEAIQLYRDHAPDLLMLDVTMAGMSGLDALSQIRREFPNAFVMMLTSSSDLETVRECIRHGAARYILKDTSMARIRVMVSEALGLAG